MAMLGGVFLDVVYSEDPERSVTTTDHPVESGEPIVDHVLRQPYTMNLTGLVTGPDAAARLRKLERLQESGTPISYLHRNGVSNVIIESFKSKHDVGTAGGFTFNIRLKRIRLSLSTPVQAMKLPAKVQTAPVGNKGLQQKQKPTQQKLTPAQKAAANGNHVKGN